MVTNNKNHERILIVEDDKEVVEQIISALASLKNFQFDVVDDGILALKKIQECKEYSLIILELLIPGKNGLEVCKAMVADETLKKIPVLLTSILPLDSDAFQQSWRRFDELKVVRDILVMPFTDKELEEKTKLILRLSRIVIS